MSRYFVNIFVIITHFCLKQQMNSFEPHIRMKKYGLELISIIEAHSGRAMFAGGSIRDQLLGLKPKDYDIATTLMPQKIMQIFSEKRIQVIPTGIDFGTVSVIHQKFTYEITTLRKDVSNDGRRANVVFSDSFEEDSRRRDFTINAMYEDKDGRIIDFHGGISDLNKGIVKFVGDPNERIDEDHLRILRFFRFLVTLKFETDDQTKEIVFKKAHLVANLSKERILQESSKIFKNLEDHKKIMDLLKSRVLLYVFFRAEDPPNYFISALSDRLMTKNAQNLEKIYKRFDQNFNHHPKSYILKMFVFFLQLKIEVEHIPDIIANLSVPKIHLKLARILSKVLSSSKEKNRVLSQSDCFKFITGLEEIYGEANFGSFSPSLFANLSNVKDQMPSFSLFERFSILEQTKRHLRKCPPLLNGQEVKDITGLKDGKELGLILNELRESQLNEEITNKTDAVIWVKNKII